MTIKNKPSPSSSPEHSRAAALYSARHGKVREAMRRTWMMVGGAIALTGLGLAACTPVPPAPTPAPSPPPIPRPAPTPTPAPPPADWRDAATTPGDWTYRADGNATRALFGQPNAGAQFTMACELSTRTIRLWRAGEAAAGTTMTITTTSEVRGLATAATGEPLPQVTASLTANDRLIDAMVFSRGRFVVAVPGLQTLYLPTWAEIARVAEDCR